MIGKLSTDNAAVRDNAVDGSIKIVTITDRGVGIGTADRTYIQRFLLKEMEQEQSVLLLLINDLKFLSVTVSNQGSGYTYGSVDFVAWWRSYRNYQTSI